MNRFVDTYLVAVVVGVLSLAQASFSYGATFTDFPTFQAATQSLTLENFDSAPWPGVFQGGLGGTANFGITWTSVNDLLSTEVLSLSGNTSITDSNGAPDSLDKITATVGVGGITAFGGFVHNAFNFSGQNDTITMTAFDGGNGVLGAVAAASPSNFKFLGITSAVDISRVDFTSSGPTPGDDFALDDVYFGQTVPEPATISLAALAFLTLLAHGHRRRS